MIRSTRHITMAFLVSMVIVLVIGGDAFQPQPTFSMWWPSLLLEGVAALVALASINTMFGRFVEWLPAALAKRRKIGRKKEEEKTRHARNSIDEHI